MTPRPAADDKVRGDIRAAMNRLLNGSPARSEGKLTIASLAVEAGVKRHFLTHKHTDLKDEFYGRVRARGEDPEQLARQSTKTSELVANNAKLQGSLREAHEREQSLIRELHLLAVENEQLRRKSATVTPLRKR